MRCNCEIHQVNSSHGDEKVPAFSKFALVLLGMRQTKQRCTSYPMMYNREVREIPKAMKVPARFNDLCRHEYHGTDEHEEVGRYACLAHALLSRRVRR